MIKTNIGLFNGKSWEALCQQVFKRRYASDGYQQIPASPGDCGLEGFTVHTGFGFQCYCPEKHYTKSELYVAQRDKITTDLGKLIKFQDQLAKLLGPTKITSWIFVTPEIDHHALVAHARMKEQDVRSWNLPFVGPNFTVLLHDGDHYLTEINELRSAAGENLDFDLQPPALTELDGPPEFYEGNIARKCRKRLAAKRDSDRFEFHLSRLQQQTQTSFLEADAYFRKIEATAPPLYFRLVRLINEFEIYVADTASTWIGTADELTVLVRDRLASRIGTELNPGFSATAAEKISRYMVARWMAICELDYE